MPRISAAKAEKRNQILSRLKRFVHFAIAELSNDNKMVTRNQIEKYMIQEGIPLYWIKWCLSMALQQAHSDGRIEKAGAVRGRGSGWKPNLSWKQKEECE